MQATHVARYDGFSPQPEIPAMKARRLDRGSQFALIACAQAVAEAGFDVADDPEAIGIAMGTGSAGAGALTEFLRVLFLESPEAAPPFHFPNTVANAPASQVSIELKIFGPNVTITQKDPFGAERAALLDARALLGPRAGDARRRRRRVECLLRDGLRPRRGPARREAAPRASSRARAPS